MYLIIYGYIFMQIVMKLQFIQNNTIQNNTLNKD